MGCMIGGAERRELSAQVSESEMESGPGLSSQALVPIIFVAFLAETSHQAALEFC